MKFFPGVEAGRFGVSVDQYSLILEYHVYIARLY